IKARKPFAPVIVDVSLHKVFCAGFRGAAFVKWTNQNFAAEPEFMEIEIEALSREELKSLVDRVRLDFRGQIAESVVAGIKKKSVTMLAGGNRQDVHPWLLTKIRSDSGSQD